MRARDKGWETERDFFWDVDNEIMETKSSLKLLLSIALSFYDFVSAMPFSLLIA